jgi:hypothetical protein
MRVLSAARPASLALAVTLIASVASVASREGEAQAQVHWDVGAQVGVMQRVQTGGSGDSPGPIPGPVGEIHAHVAVVPMLRVGPYLAHDLAPYAPSADLPARQITEGGLRAKLAPPLLSGPWHLWALLGLGYARAYWPSHTVGGGASVGGIEGDILDLPVGVGVGYRLRGPRDPWEVTAELGGRVGLAFFGAMYSDAPRDSFALSLTLGVSLQE